MAGTRKGGLKAAKRNRELYGENFYAQIGAKGGSLSNTGGFAANRELARKAGAIGGRISRRTKSASSSVGVATKLQDSTKKKKSVSNN